MKWVRFNFKKIFKNISDKIKMIRTDHLIKEYFKNNMLLITYLITVVLNSTILRFFCMHSIENFLSFKAILADLTVALFIGSFAYLFKPKNRFTYLLCCNIFLTAICMVNSVYYTFYTSFASVSMLSLTQYIGDVGDAVVENVIQLKDLVYIIGPLIFVYVHIRLKKKNYYKKVEIKSERKKKTLKTIGASGILLVIFLLTMTSLDVSRFMKQWNKEYVVMRFGIYVYQINDVFISIQPKINSMFGYDQAKKEFDEYFSNVSESAKTNEYTNIFAGKNIILTHGESMMTNAIDLSFNGVEVTLHIVFTSKLLYNKNTIKCTFFS